MSEYGNTFLVLYILNLVRQTKMLLKKLEIGFGSPSICNDKPKNLNLLWLKFSTQITVFESRTQFWQKCCGSLRCKKSSVKNLLIPPIKLTLLWLLLPLQDHFIFQILPQLFMFHKDLHWKASRVENFAAFQSLVLYLNLPFSLLA